MATGRDRQRCEPADDDGDQRWRRRRSAQTSTVWRGDRRRSRSTLRTPIARASAPTNGSRAATGVRSPPPPCRWQPRQRRRASPASGRCVLRRRSSATPPHCAVGARAHHQLSPATHESWTSARTDAVRRSRSCAVRRQTSTSSVGWLGPPSTRTTPNDVKQNRNTMVADATIAGRSSGNVRWRIACQRRGPEGRCGIVELWVDACCERADRAHDDGEVDPDVGDDDRGNRAMHLVGQQREERGADGDRREHERHGDQRQHGPPAGETEPSEHVGGDEADRHGQGRAHRRLPEREPDDRALPLVAEHIGDRCQVESPARRWPRRARRRRRRGTAPARPPASRPCATPPREGRCSRQPRTVRVHVSTHSSRWAAMSAGGTVSGFSTCSANRSKTSGSSTSRRAG